MPDLVPAASAAVANVALLLWEAAAQAPEQIAIVQREHETTYRELKARAVAVAVALRDVGVLPGDRVCILLERSADAAACFFGAVACGAIAINVNETLRPRQIEHILSHSGSRVLVTTRELLARHPRPLQTSARVIDVADLAPRESHEDGGLPVRRLERDIAQIIYTSGSTGLPKGVTLMHANLWNGARIVSGYLRITASDRIASLLPFSFDYGFNQLLCAVAQRATLVIERSVVPHQIADTLRSQRVTILPCVPPLWLQLLSAPAFRDEPIPTLRTMTNTGGRIPIEGVRRLRAAQPQAELFLMYGLTEAFRGTFLPPELVDMHPESIGRAIPGSEILVLRDDLTPCVPGEIGELVQRGSTVAAGYWNDPDATARVFRSNPLRPDGQPDHERVVFSGDLVRMDENGLLYYVGRRDRVIKSLGYRISPDEITDVIHASGQVLEAIVGTEPDAVRGELIVTYVVLTPEGSLKELERFCRTELPRHLQPGRIEVRSELPRTTSGKFDLRAAQEVVAE